VRAAKELFGPPELFGRKAFARLFEVHMANDRREQFVGRRLFQIGNRNIP
jgi:hypothetical protein